MSSRFTILRSVKSMPVTSVRQHFMTGANSDFTLSSILQSNLLYVSNVGKVSTGWPVFRYDKLNTIFKKKYPTVRNSTTLPLNSVVFNTYRKMSK